MEEVGNYLQREAIQRTDPHQRDLFGRSAFNRFYYATFIPLSNALAKMKPEWGGLPHKNVPTVLRESVIKGLKEGSKRANRVGDYDTVSVCSRAIDYCHQLADLMESGYAIRVTADYNSAVPVDFTLGTDFRLASVPVSAAKQWPGRAVAYVEAISNAWRQINEQ